MRLVTNEPLAGLGPAVQIGGDMPPVQRCADALSDLDDEQLGRLGDELGVPRQPAETFRARCAATFNDDAAIAAAIPTTTPRQVLGGMKLGG